MESKVEHSSQNYFDLLSDEILLNILHFFEYREQVAQMKLICKRFFVIASDKTLTQPYQFAEIDYSRGKWIDWGENENSFPYQQEVNRVSIPSTIHIPMKTVKNITPVEGASIINGRMLKLPRDLGENEKYKVRFGYQSVSGKGLSPILEICDKSSFTSTFLERNHRITPNSVLSSSHYFVYEESISTRVHLINLQLPEKDEKIISPKDGKLEIDKEVRSDTNKNHQAKDHIHRMIVSLEGNFLFIEIGDLKKSSKILVWDIKNSRSLPGEILFSLYPGDWDIRGAIGNNKIFVSSGMEKKKVSFLVFPLVHSKTRNIIEKCEENKWFRENSSSLFFKDSNNAKNNSENEKEDSSMTEKPRPF